MTVLGRLSPPLSGLSSSLEELSPTLYSRWMAKVDRSGQAWDCWPWLAYTAPDGYGRMSIGRANGRQSAGYAHRVAYWLFIGPIPSGMQVDHLCRNRQCVNPNHLRAATPLENSHNTEIGNAGKEFCPAGHPYDEVNTYFYTSADGTRRFCRPCRKQWVQEWRERNKDAA